MAGKEIEWWRVERFQALFNASADKSTDPDAKTLYAQSAQRFSDLSTLVQKGSYGTIGGKSASLDDALDYVVAPANQVRALADAGRPGLFEQWEDVLKSFQWMGGPMRQALEETHDLATAASQPQPIAAPVTARFRPRQKLGA
ncbi:MAG TPA: hypothetical protein VEF76_07165 [Patescibacteria group bacterium]|nr:hypothetical protein [Patescibacteria group bacterium]